MKICRNIIVARVFEPIPVSLKTAVLSYMQKIKVWSTNKIDELSDLNHDKETKETYN